MIIKVILEWDSEAQSYSATCPELNYISSCGDTQEEAIENLKDAIQLFLEPISDSLVNINGNVDRIEVLI
jgi:predicted RNase H-like HicB family nuclease